MGNGEITISFKLHMTINEINNVVNNIYVEDTQLQLLWGVKKN